MIAVVIMPNGDAYLEDERDRIAIGNVVTGALALDDPAISRAFDAALAEWRTETTREEIHAEWSAIYRGQQGYH